MILIRALYVSTHSTRGLHVQMTSTAAAAGRARDARPTPEGNLQTTLHTSALGIAKRSLAERQVLTSHVLRL